MDESFKEEAEVSKRENVEMWLQLKEEEGRKVKDAYRACHNGVECDKDFVDWVFNHVIIQNLVELSKGDGEWTDMDGDTVCYYEDYDNAMRWGCYRKGDEGETIHAGTLNVEFINDEGEWKAVIRAYHPVEVTEEMKTLLDKVVEAHSK